MSSKQEKKEHKQLSLPLMQKVSAQEGTQEGQADQKDQKGQKRQEVQKGQNDQRTQEVHRDQAVHRTQEVQKRQEVQKMRSDSMPESQSQNKDFEATIAELDEIVQQLEGEVKLEEALSLFERGMKLSQHCEDFLKSAEQQIEILKKAADGSLSTEKFKEAEQI